MRFVLPLACRVILGASEKLVPEALRETWHEQWRGDLWRWMLSTAEAGDSEGRFALLSHTKQAVRDAWAARFRSDPGAAGVSELLGHPRFCLALCALPLVLLTLASGVLRNLRGLAAALPYPDASRVILLAQGPPVFGVRIGFNDRELREFESKSKTLESMASYVWRTGRVASIGDFPIAYVSPNFFEVLRAYPARLGEGEFLASETFWRKHLRRDPSSSGQHFDIGGRTLRLAGVLPKEFSFLSTSIAIWAPASADHAPVPSRWWLGLKGAVARLRPGVSTAETARELHQLQVQSGIARRNFTMKATPVEDLVFAQVRSYGSDLLIAVGLTLAWAIFGFAMDYRQGRSLALAARYWGFFTAKPLLLLCALFVWLFEFTGVSTLGMTGGLQGPRGGPLLVWWTFLCAAGIFVWAWRDQRARCRVCLQPMRQPLRIGVPGQILLETAGEEIMCPQGHGFVYTSDSVLGSEMSKRWMGFEDSVK